MGHCRLFHNFYLPIYLLFFWLCWDFAAAQATLAATRGPLASRCLLLLQRTGCRAQACYLRPTGWASLWHVGSSRTRDRNHASCIGRRSLPHQATRGAPGRLRCSLTCCRYLGGPQVLAIVSSAAVNIRVQVFFWTRVLFSSGIGVSVSLGQL